MMTSWKGKCVVVTGGTGFIGSFLVERLLDAGANVRVPVRASNYRSLSSRRDEIEWVEGDLRDPTYCETLLQGADHLFHAAAHRRNFVYHRKYCGDVMAENALMTVALLKGLKETGSMPVTFLSTANVPLTSDVILLAQSENLDGYVLGKALCETLWFAASRQRKFPLLIVRPVGAYGPRDTFSEDGNVIPSLMVRARNSEDKLVVWGSGDQERAFLFIDDLIDATLTMIDAQAQGIQYIVPPNAITIRELAETIRDIVNPELTITFDKVKPEGARSFARLPLHDSLLDFPWTSFIDGLKRTYAWWTSSRTDVSDAEPMRSVVLA
jgi:nucleoside-diphosphate-sugar epimerase